MYLGKKLIVYLYKSICYHMIRNNVNKCLPAWITNKQCLIFQYKQATYRKQGDFIYTVLTLLSSQTVWIQIRTDRMSVLISIQMVWYSDSVPARTFLKVNFEKKSVDYNKSMTNCPPDIYHIYCNFRNFSEGFIFVIAKFRKNKILMKWRNRSVVYWYR